MSQRNSSSSTAARTHSLDRLGRCLRYGGAAAWPDSQREEMQDHLRAFAELTEGMMGDSQKWGLAAMREGDDADAMLV